MTERTKATVSQPVASVMRGEYVHVETEHCCLFVYLGPLFAWRVGHATRTVGRLERRRTRRLSKLGRGAA